VAVNIRQAVRVLELLAPEAAGLRVSHIAEELAVNKAIAHRIVTALTEAGYVQQDPVSGRYAATFRLGALGLRQLESAGIDEWAQQPLDHLARETRELVRLAVATGSRLQWVAKAQGSDSRLVVDAAMGADVALHATANGKAWLSTLDEDEVDRILGAEPLPRHTPNTKTDPALLREEIGRARMDGFATTFEEMDLGINAIAAPVLGAGRAAPATGTVSVAGPSTRLHESELLAFVTELLKTAEQLAASWPAYGYLAKARAAAS
jgi:IclR family acetate operon transcriptional repressor